MQSIPLIVDVLDFEMDVNFWGENLPKHTKFLYCIDILYLFFYLFINIIIIFFWAYRFGSPSNMNALLSDVNFKHLNSKKWKVINY